MKLLEFEGKTVLARYGLSVPRGEVVSGAEEAETAARTLGGKVMVKAQVHTGGRGKAGGIKEAANPSEAAKLTEAMLGIKIKGYTVEKVYIEEQLQIKKEYYLAVTYDRAAGLPVLILSSQGGIDIEKVAGEEPEHICRLHIDPLWGLHPYQIRKLASAVGIGAEDVASVAIAALQLYKVFWGVDARLAEINPAVITEDGNLFCADSKLELDDSAAFRQSDLFETLHTEPVEAVEMKAREHDISFVKLEGNVAVIGNGAGLVMGTLDSISHEGGSPANFLDIGGGALADKMEQAVKIALDNPEVNTLLINIFGGITRCDEVARGIIAAFKELSPAVPVVIRLGGNNEAEGQKILAESGIGFEIYKTMREATRKAAQYALEG